MFNVSVALAIPAEAKVTGWDSAVIRLLITRLLALVASREYGWKSWNQKEKDSLTCPEVTTVTWLPGVRVTFPASRMSVGRARLTPSLVALPPAQTSWAYESP